MAKTMFHKTETLPPHEDWRRTITDCFLPQGMPFAVKQIKLIDLKAVGMVVGDHYHTEDSGREEFFIPIGPPDTVLFTYRWRMRGGEVEERRLMAGDACHIMATCSHAFRLEHPEAKLWGLANMAYNAAHDVPDKLF